MPSLTFIKDVSIVLAGVVALVTFIFGALQFAMQARQTRAAQLVEMRRRFLEDKNFREILNLVAANSPQLSTVPIQERRNLVGFLEEIALLMNSKMIRNEVAFVMFGHYTIQISQCVAFWEGLDRESVYWTVFRNFSAEMSQLQKQAELHDERLRF